jgi:hypothetical protein
MKLSHLARPCLVIALAACGGDPEPSPVDSGIIDDLAVIPETPEGAIRIDFPEQIIAPGADVMTCFYTEAFGEDTFVGAADEFQGNRGHHLLLFKPLAGKPAGTVEDCTDEASMATFFPSIFTRNFAGGDVPEGYAVKLPAGSQLVIQQHYVNPMTKPLRVRDAVMLHTVEAAAVTEELSFFALTDVSFEIPPQVSEHTVEIDCEPVEDVEMLMFGPHMHEWGERMGISLSRDAGATWETVHEVPAWDVTFRDLPPVGRLFDAPLVVGPGDTLRVSCTFSNTLDEPLGFPKEMCAYYGYFLSPSGAPSWICSD